MGENWCKINRVSLKRSRFKSFRSDELLSGFATPRISILISLSLHPTPILNQRLRVALDASFIFIDRSPIILGPAPGVYIYKKNHILLLLMFSYFDCVYTSLSTGKNLKKFSPLLCSETCLHNINNFLKQWISFRSCLLFGRVYLENWLLYSFST